MADDSEEYNKPAKSGKTHNVLPLWGNEQTMNLNPLILANIQGSSYFKVHLFKLKTYHEVVDEIYYQVNHLEPWERGSRKTAGQTGMCGGVRGVGAGGIVSTAYCLLYKLYTLRLTRKQLNGLLTHSDSPFIRALGFMYVRYTQPPSDLFDWYKEYLGDDEPVDPRAGGGQPTTIGNMARHMLTKLDWFSTLFPRIPVPIQKLIEQRLSEYDRQNTNKNNWRNDTNTNTTAATVQPPPDKYPRDSRDSRDRNGRRDRETQKDRDRDRGERERERDRDRSRGERDRDRERDRNRDRDRDRERDRERYKNRDRSPRDRRHR